MTVVRDVHIDGARGLAPLDEIRAYVEVARARSFSAAAQRVGASHSSYSRKVQHLEKWLGVQLLNRTPSGVTLTHAGVHYLRRFSEALGIIDELVSTSPRFESQRPVRISVVPMVASHLLLPLHNRICSRIDGLSIQYIMDMELTDFSDGTDIAIRYGSGTWSNIQSVLIRPVIVRPQAARSIADKLGPDPAPERLLEYPLIHFQVDTTWRSWFHAQGITFERRSQDHVISDAMTGFTAVQHSVGIGLLREGVHPPPDGVNVVFVSTRSVNVGTGYFLVRPQGRRLRPVTRRYVMALLQELGNTEADIAAFVED